MKKTIIINTLLFLLLIENTAKVDLKQADKLYSKQEYFEALKVYKEIYKKEEISATHLLNFGNCYYFLNDFLNAEKIYFRLDTIKNKNEIFTGDDYSNYGRTLQYLKRYNEAIKKFKEAQKLGIENEEIINIYISSCVWAKNNNEESNKWQIKRSILNTDGQSFGVQYFKEGLVYSAEIPTDNEATEQKEGKLKKRKNKLEFDERGNKFQNLFYVDLNETEPEPLLKSKKLFSEKLSSPHHVGAVSFSKDFKYIYYTKTVQAKNTNNTILKIYEAEYNEDTLDWINEVELPFNNDEYSCAHPATSAMDKNVLYFTSNKPGGIGGKDLYVTFKNDNNWSEPLNLGSKINTVGDELFPFIGKNNILYFSSNGRQGYGGLDIYSSKSINNEKWEEVTNMKKPINSSKDDFAFVLSNIRRDQGFFSSSRDGNGNIDFIHTFQQKTDSQLAVFGNIYNSFTKEIIPEVTVVLKDTETGNVISQTVSRPDGYFAISFDEKALDNLNTVALAFTKKGEAVSFTEEITKDELLKIIDNSLNDQGYNVEMTPITPLLDYSTVPKLGTGQTSSSVNGLSGLEDNNNQSTLPTTDKTKKEYTFKISDDKLHFNYNEAIINTLSSKIILHNFANFLKENPQLRVEITAHTDSRGSVDYNFNLSERRAQSSKEYLIVLGVAPNRIKARGYGEKYLLNRCKNGISCSEEEHKQNRRIEIKVKNY